MASPFRVVLGIIFSCFIAAPGQAEETWQAIPSCARAILWSSRAGGRYWEDSLEPIYEENAGDHERQVIFVLSQIHLDTHLFGDDLGYFFSCIQHPSRSNDIFFEAITECRPQLFQSMRITLKKTINKYSDDRPKALEAAIEKFNEEYECEKSPCPRVEDFIKCIKYELKNNVTIEN